MPKLDVLPFDLQELVSTYLAHRTPYRTPGVHTSDIIQSMIKDVPSLAKTLDSTPETRDLMFTLGLVWETAIGEHTKWPAPVPQARDGIICSPDELNPLEERIGEMKATWKSAWNYNILDDWRYMTQAMAYCYVWGVLKCRFWIFHINGDYRPPSPKGFAYDLTFTQKELNENWFMLVQHKNLMIRRGDVKTQ